MSLILEVDHLDVTHGAIRALSGVSIVLQQAQIVAVLGPNGAGKSSLLECIMGIVPARRGRIVFDGRAVDQLDVEQRVAMGISLVPAAHALFGSMSVEDNLRLGRFRLRRGGAAGPMLKEVYALFPRLLQCRKHVAARLSGGERQMLAIGRALMSEPRLLMLDEPSASLAPPLVAEILRAAMALRANGVSILLVEQNARAALRIADRGYLLEQGRVVMDGLPEELAADNRIVEAYLGLRGATA